MLAEGEVAKVQLSKRVSFASDSRLLRRLNRSLPFPHITTFTAILCLERRSCMGVQDHTQSNIDDVELPLHLKEPLFPDGLGRKTTRHGLRTRLNTISSVSYSQDLRSNDADLLARCSRLPSASSEDAA